MPRIRCKLSVSAGGPGLTGVARSIGPGATLPAVPNRLARGLVVAAGGRGAGAEDAATAASRRAKAARSETWGGGALAGSPVAKTGPGGGAGADVRLAGTAAPEMGALALVPTGRGAAAGGLAATGARSWRSP